MQTGQVTTGNTSEDQTHHKHYDNKNVVERDSDKEFLPQ